MSTRTDRILSFLKIIEKCKVIERQIYNSNLNRRESDAEHSWHLAMFLFLFKKDLPKKLDFEKMLKLALMHDLVEIYAGDTFAYDKPGQSTKKERENKAALKLFSKLPEDLNKEFSDLFNEYQEVNTTESKMVKSFDKIQPIFQNICSGGKSWIEHLVTLKQINDYKRRHMVHNDFILAVYEKLLEDAKNKGLLPVS